MHKIWVADDDAAIRMVLEESLSSAGFLTSMFPDADSLLEQLKVDKPDLIITDVKMPGSLGYDLLKHINDNFEQIPVIIMTAFTDMQAAVDSYGGGAFEYMPKPFDLDEAIEIVNRALEGKPITKGLKAKPSSEIIGKASSMQLVFRAIGKLSNTNATVLIQGESGTGKELIAKSLHKNSPRNDMPFVALNMADIPKELVESELFGHEKGAFTGAVDRRIGRFEQANGGTLFLDEIGDMPLECQTRLLRVLSKEALEFLEKYDWPGNVRQLENICYWLTLMSPTQNIKVEDLPSEVKDHEVQKVEASLDWEQGLAAWLKDLSESKDSDLLDIVGPKLDKVLIQTALEKTNGRKNEAAVLLGWGRNTLSKKIKELGL